MWKLKTWEIKKPHCLMILFNTWTSNNKRDDPPKKPYLVVVVFVVVVVVMGLGLLLLEIYPCKKESLLWFCWVVERKIEIRRWKQIEKVQEIAVEREGYLIWNRNRITRVRVSILTVWEVRWACNVGLLYWVGLAFRGFICLEFLS